MASVFEYKRGSGGERESSTTTDKAGSADEINPSQRPLTSAKVIRVWKKNERINILRVK